MQQPLAGSSMSFCDIAQMGPVCRVGKVGLDPGSAPVGSGAPRVLCRQAALLPRHIHRARPRYRQDRPSPGRSGPAQPGPDPPIPGQERPIPGPDHPLSDRVRAGPFTVTTGPSRFRTGRSPARTSPSLGRLDHPPSPPRSQPGAAAPPRSAAARGDFRGCGGRREAARAGRGASMAAMSSLEAVRRKIRSLQEQADAAEERAGRLQREVDQERALREEVGPPLGPGIGGAGPGARLSSRRSGRSLPSPPCPTGWLLPAGPAAGSARSAAFPGSVTRVLRGPGPGAASREGALGVLGNSKTPSGNEVGLRRVA